MGRSGIYCAVSNALEQCKAEGVVDVFQTVKAIRMQKQEAVSTVVRMSLTDVLTDVFILSCRNSTRQCLMLSKHTLR